MKNKKVNYIKFISFYIIMQIPEEYILHETRCRKDWKGITIYGYKRKDVISAFQNAMINNHIEDAIRWCVELHATGLNTQIWDSLHLIYIKHIHINNIKFLFYYIQRKKEYQEIISNYTRHSEIMSRNNQEIRNIYAELTSIITLSKKTNIFIPSSLPKIHAHSFQKEDIRKRMISKDLRQITPFIFNDTTSESKLALNEIFHNLLYENGTYQNCIYWYIWLEKVNKSIPKIKINVQQEEYNNHWIFIIWNIIKYFIDQEEINRKKKIYIYKLYSLYKERFTLSQIQKKKYYLFLSFYLLKHTVYWNTPIFQQENVILQINANINKMYQNIIRHMEKELSVETKEKLYKRYHQLCIDSNTHQTTLIKYVETNNEEEINKVLCTKYPEYIELTKEPYQHKVIKHIDTMENDISINMTDKNIEDEKVEKAHKKLHAYAQFVPYKKEKDISKQLIPSIEEKDVENKNIFFEKRNHG